MECRKKMECVICLEVIDIDTSRENDHNKNNITKDDSSINLECCVDSRFHKECYQKYTSKGFKTCPLCRQYLELEEGRLEDINNNTNTIISSLGHARIHVEESIDEDHEDIRVRLKHGIKWVVGSVLLFILLGVFGGLLLYFMNGSDEMHYVGDGLIVEKNMTIFQEDFVTKEWNDVVIKMLKNHAKDKYQGSILGDYDTKWSMRFAINNISYLKKQLRCQKSCHTVSGGKNGYWNIPNHLHLSVVPGPYDNTKMYVNRIQTTIPYYTFDFNLLLVAQVILGGFVATICYGLLQKCQNCN